MADPTSADKFETILATLGAVSTLVVPFYLWSIRVTLKISQAVFGPDGRNGINGTVRGLAENQQEISATVRELHGRHLKVEEEILRNRQYFHDDFVTAVNGVSKGQLEIAGAIRDTATANRELAQAVGRIASGGR